MKILNHEFECKHIGLVYHQHTSKILCVEMFSRPRDGFFCDTAQLLRQDKLLILDSEV